ncbi:MAG TPA: TatD family hydrolase [Candidatus Moranbacteria bacterium]|nr:TatD family hydrolase [Candidatus Moranbacteria bacterium]HRY27946.1 TatD family hydrolase [Candidatus Moranbacteria bacterium]HSA08238.1 TatD family hydrolase [Candidatus Moranbacteria bacterium]
MFFDSHAHVNFSAFKEDGEEVLKKCLAEGVFVVNVGSQYSTSQRAVEYAHKFETGIFAAIGIHPVHLKAGAFKYNDPGELDEVPASTRGDRLSTRGGEIKTKGEEFEYEKYLELARDEKVVAIGEVGLDYHHFDEGDNIEELKKQQKEVLIKFIKMANEVNKPIVLHCWGVKSRKELVHTRTDAYDDLLEILQKYSVARKGIVHSFVGSHKTANKFIEMGYKIGINGIITYSESYDRLIKEIDLANIVIETDCPYLTPVPHKGERNEPIFVKLVAEKIATVKNIPLAEVAEKTTQNAKLSLDIL